MIMAESAESICSIMSATRRLASARRFSSSSVDCMLAELSSRKIRRSSRARVEAQLGRNSASIRSATNRSWRKRSRFWRMRCQRLLTCRSSMLLCQR